jgi:hypothetical protein
MTFTVATGLLLIISKYANKNPMKHYIEFIKSADEVTLITSESNEIALNELRTLPLQELNAQAKGCAITRVKLRPENRSNLVQLLSFEPDRSGREAKCFDPHHFVVAKKGNRTATFEICYECGYVHMRLDNNFLSVVPPRPNGSLVDEVFQSRYFAKQAKRKATSKRG